MANNFSILGDLDTANLQNRGLLSPSHSTGPRRIHERRLTARAWRSMATVLSMSIKTIQIPSMHMLPRYYPDCVYLLGYRDAYFDGISYYSDDGQGFSGYTCLSVSTKKNLPLPRKKCGTLRHYRYIGAASSYRSSD
ncbi:hypothetical protein F5B20DRAFT_191987 [Whalleya microplaca]|nr:hypothetical protein F5B20DRAFT_191987 [Whalleya microplaca]